MRQLTGKSVRQRVRLTRAVFWVDGILVTIAVSLAPLAAQQHTQLSAVDSAELRLAVIRTLLDSVPSPWTAATRLWVRPPSRYDKEAKQRIELQFTRQEWSAIREEFPTAVLASWDEDLFLCPPGREVRMPVIGCPISEDGLIFSFSEIMPAEDGRVQAGGDLIQSDNDVTWRHGLYLLFARNAAGKWQLVEVLGRAIS